jgi:hypothetical protein
MTLKQCMYIVKRRRKAGGPSNNLVGYYQNHTVCSIHNEIRDKLTSHPNHACQSEITLLLLDGFCEI